MERPLGGYVHLSNETSHGPHAGFGESYSSPLAYTDEEWHDADVLITEPGLATTGLIRP
jgi:hypothetical protein